jgi:hypothetical protein
MRVGSRPLPDARQGRVAGDRSRRIGPCLAPRISVAEASQYVFLPILALARFPNESIGEVWPGFGPDL